MLIFDILCSIADIKEETENNSITLFHFYTSKFVFLCSSITTKIKDEKPPVYIVNDTT